MDQTPALSVGLLVCAKSASDATHYIIGSIAAINGNDIDIAVTIAGGGTAKADWVVTYPISGNVFDGNGDFATPDGSFSAKSGDADLSVGGNRAVMDFSAGYARYGAAWGGGPALGLALHVNGTNLLVTDNNSNIKTIFGGNRIVDGAEYGQADYGSISSTTISLGWNTAQVVLAEIGAAVIINFWAPDTTNHYAKTIQITQDGTGGRVPTFQRHLATSQIQWTTPEPDWASMAAAEVWRVTAQYLDYWLYLSAVKVKS